MTHGLLALCYGLGLCWTLLGVLDLTAWLGPAAVVLAALTALWCLGGLNRPTCMVIWGLGTAGTVVWLLGGGARMVGEVMVGVTLHLTGVGGALPMVAQETALLLAAICSLAGWGLTHRSVGAYPSAALMAMVLLLLWLSDAPDMLIWLLPSGAAVLSLLVMSSHAGLSLRRILPMMAAIVLGAALVLPTGGVTIEPLQDAAEKLRQLIYDYLFFTEPRDVFTLAIEGYYPQGQSQLGGKPEISDRPVMQVITPRRTYLRGVVKNEYTGQSWQDTTGSRRYLWQSLRWQESRNQIFDLDKPVTGPDALPTETVTVRMLAGSTSTLFVPQRIRSLSPQGDLVAYFNPGSELFATRNLAMDDTWSVQASLVRAGDAGLEDLLAECAAAGDDQYESIRRTYTVLPDYFSLDIFDKARDAAALAGSPYAMALALQEYLATNYRYTIDVAPHPAGQDFVATFLLQTKEGYCTYFASAMTVLCRLVGLPARYVEGYVAVPDASGRATVTGENGHAWTEVYFAGYGWLTFDATPWAMEEIAPPADGDHPPQESPQPSQEPESTPTPPPPSEKEDETDASTPSPQPTLAPTDAPTAAPDAPDADGKQGSFPWWLLVVLALAARVLMTLPGVRAVLARNDLDRWMVWSQALHDALWQMKLRRAPEESPLTFLRRAEKRLPLSLAPQVQAEAVMFYAHAAPEEAEIRFARDAYHRLMRHLPWWQRPILHLRRAFLPAGRMDFTRS